MIPQHAPRWRPGEIITWSYRNPRIPDIVELRPVTVAVDAEDHLALWLAPATPVLTAVSADGRRLRSLEGIGRFSAPRAQAVSRWSGPGILAVLLPGRPYSVWCFETAPGRRQANYINIEREFRRTASGVVSQDQVLDIVVDADRACRLKDEDELTMARTAGLFSDAEVTAIRLASERAIADVARGVFPFDGSCADFMPDPDWPVPDLPAGANWEFDLRD